MKNKLRFTLGFLLLASSWACARDATALKADLQRMLPSGKSSIKLAWIKGGPSTEFAIGTSNTAVYVVSSEDGVIRKLYPTTGTGGYNSVNITADGSRVMFLNSNAGNIVVVNWNGTNARTLNISDKPIEYWRNPADGSDWAVTEVGGMSRINIDNTSQRVSVAGWGCSEDGFGLSDDGATFYGFDYNRNPAAFGMVTVSSLKFTAGPHGGCQGSLGAGKTPLYNHNPSGHTQLCVHDAANQSSFTLYPVAKTVFDSLKKVNQTLASNCLAGDIGGSTEGNRFSQYPNFVTLMHTQSKVNPILMRLPDMKFVYIEDNLSCTFCGDMDAVFLPYTGIATKAADNGRSAARPSLAKQFTDSETYLLNGRRINVNGADARTAPVAGIVIRELRQGGHAALAPVVIR